jgi:hypothetical protein
VLSEVKISRPLELVSSKLFVDDELLNKALTTSLEVLLSFNLAAEMPEAHQATILFDQSPGT